MDVTSLTAGGGIATLALVMMYKICKENGCKIDLKSQCLPKCCGGDNDDFEIHVDTNQGSRASSESEFEVVRRLSEVPDMQTEAKAVVI